MGFTFVDHISAIDAERARGRIHRAEGAPPLPPWLVIEAIGQLAAWIAIRRTDFQSRPVAALVGEARVSSAAVGGIVELEARIDRFDGRAVLYSGEARIAGAEVAALARSVGPMLPMDGFDDRAAVRQRFEVLCAAGSPSEPRDIEVPRVVLSALDVRGGSAHAQLRVPTTASFFAEHFPHRPVYPATLLVDGLNQLAMPVSANALGIAPESVRLTRMTNFKVRAFSPPGQVLDLTAEARPADVCVAMSAAADGKRVASCLLEHRATSAPAR